MAYEELPRVFPGAKISANTKAPGGWDSLSVYGEQQVLLIVSPGFYPDDYEWGRIMRFVESGNHVFISTLDPGEIVEKELNITAKQTEFTFGSLVEADTLKASLANPPFATDKQYTYPGKKWYAYLSAMDSVVATPLGKAENGKTDFIHLKAGKGSLYLHLSPFTFTNYFLLREKNLQYYEQALSVLPNDSKQVVWDEYFVKKKERKQRESQNWFAAVLKQPGLGEGILLAIGLMLLYVLLELRRKQRPIPVIDRPRNDSLDFVRTIGRLYYDTGDHKNLATKMSGYFLEHIRTKYKIATGELNEAFIAKLQFKTGVQEQEIAGIVNAIRNIDAAPAVSEQQLLQFHKQLEEFYTKA